MERLKLISENVENDQLNIERYVKERTTVCKDMFRATGAIFEQEHLRLVNMLVATGIGGGAGGGCVKLEKGTMEDKVIHNLRAVSGDTSLFKHWRQKFTTAPGQVGGKHEERVHRFVKGIDFVKKMEKIVTVLGTDYGN